MHLSRVCTKRFSDGQNRGVKEAKSWVTGDGISKVFWGPVARGVGIMVGN